jgi:predicted helicase
MNSFNEIYILDLHGNTLKKERCPDGSKDENVFDIKQGVAIALFIKHRPELVEGKKGGKEDCKVYHSEFWGLREEKYDWLLENNIKTTNWQKISPRSRFYLFIPREEKLFEVYENFPKITDIFPLNSVGIVTARDSFVIDFDKEALKRRFRMFRDGKMPDEIIRQTFNLKDKSNWKLADARERVRKEENWEDSITQILYRPFDVQWIFYHEAVNERSRKEVMRHMMQENLGLITARSNKSSEMDHFFCSDKIMETKCGESTTQSYLFPLYIYPDSDKKDLFSHKKEMTQRQPNISPDIFTALYEIYKNKPTPEKIIYYIYAVLNSNTYRAKYAEFLRIDFPGVPFTRNYKLFCRMGEYGKRLVDLHLLKSEEIDPPTAKFEDKGENKIEKVKYKDSRVSINKDQYFEKITEEVWQYQIGGYQVCDKWLKDRKGRRLSLEDIKHYCKVVTALKNTIEVQNEIDNLYPEIEKEIIEFKNLKTKQ